MRLSLPLSEAEVRSLRLGDTVFLDGIIHTGRDEMHLRALENRGEGTDLPVDLAGTALFHCGPIVRRRGEGWELIAAGPTTSARMDSLEPGFIGSFRPGAIIGKGGMSLPTVEAMTKHGCVYLAMPGGTAALAARRVRRVIGVEWLDLGIPEALWTLEVEDFGPLTVAIDAHGNSLYRQVEAEVRERLPGIRMSLGLERDHS